MLGCQDNPLWLAPLLTEISLQGISCMVTWPPAFNPLLTEVPYGFLCFKPQHNFPG